MCSSQPCQCSARRLLVQQLFSFMGEATSVPFLVPCEPLLGVNATAIPLYAVRAAGLHPCLIMFASPGAQKRACLDQYFTTSHYCREVFVPVVSSLSGLTPLFCNRRFVSAPLFIMRTVVAVFLIYSACESSQEFVSVRLSLLTIELTLSCPALLCSKIR